jgi:hypothetical protein
MPAMVGTRLEFQCNGGGGSQRVFSFSPNWAAPILTQRLPVAERPFTGTFAPFGRYCLCKMPVKCGVNGAGSYS